MTLPSRSSHRRAREPRHARRLGAAFTALAVGSGLFMASAGEAGAAVGVPVTYADHTYDTTVNRPSENKPQSKLWHAAGAWWGLLVSSSDSRVHIFELMPNHTWRDTGVQVDDRLNSTGDAHWSAAENKLTVASRAGSSNLKVARFTFAPGSRSWSRDSGFPVTVNTGGGSESATIDRDSTGRFWVTYTRVSRVWVASSDPTGQVWSAGFAPTVPDVSISSDDISSVLAFRGQIGVMWSDQASHAFRMAIHNDGDPDGVWRVEDALAGTNLADDHINLKTTAEDAQGRLYAAVKTSQDAAGPSAALVGVLIRTPVAGGGGTWEFVVAGTVADDHTRPIIQIDKTNKELYFFATAPVSGGDIYYKKTSLANPSFGPGRGQKFMDAAPVVNNASGSKDPVTAQTGMVILGVAEGKKQYYHAEMELSGGISPPPGEDTTAPTTPMDLTAAQSPGAVDLTWSPSSDANGVTGYRVHRGGAELGNPAAPSFRDTTVVPGQTYSYTVQARDAAGNWSGLSTPVTVTVPSDPPPTGGGVAFRAATTASNGAEATLTIPSPATAAGDVLLATVDYRGQATVTPPGGWNLVGSVLANGTVMRKATYWRVATATEPTAHTWRFGAKPAAVGSILAYSGASTTSPVEATAAQVTAKATSITAPSVTASAGSAVVGLFGIARIGTVTPPPGTAERAEVSSPPTVAYPMTGEVSDRTQSASGATGALVAEASTIGPNIGQVVVLRGA